MTHIVHVFSLFRSHTNDVNDSVKCFNADRMITAINIPCRVVCIPPTNDLWEFFLYLNRDCIINSDVTCNRIFRPIIKYVRDHAARIFGLDGKYDRLSEEIKSLSGVNTVHIIMHRKHCMAAVACCIWSAKL